MSANALNEHFISTVKAITPPPCDSPRPPSPALAESGFNFRPVSAKEVEGALSSVRVTGVTGSNNISSRMLRLSGKEISPVVTKMFNISLAAGQFPSASKNAVVTPVFKKGCKCNVNNYRPNAILPVLSRMFERPLAAQLSSQLKENTLLARVKRP